MALPDRVSRLGGCLLGIALLSACAEPSLLERSEDLLHHAPAPTSEGASRILEAEVGEPTMIHCGNRANFAVPLHQGSKGSAVVLTGAAPRLVLSGCRPFPEEGSDLEEGSDPAAERPPGMILFAIDGKDGVRRHATMPIPRHGQWWHQTLDLEALEDDVLRIRFRVRLPPGERLYLSEAMLHHGVPAASPNPRARQVLLVSMDTLRADEIPLDFGEGSTNLPSFARLTAAAERWHPHYSASSWTQPSHASLLTGQPLEVHGANDHALHPAVPTLAERLRAAGFRTAGSVYDCVWLNEKFGFQRGFEDFRSGKWWMNTTVQHALGWMGDHRGEDFFYFLHLYEPHSDYQQLPYEGQDTSVDDVAEWGFPEYGCRQGECASRLLRGLREGAIQPLEGEGPLLRRLYQGGIRDADRGLGELLDGLEQLGIWDNLLLIVTSDHGEFFLEHGELLHGSYWEEGLRVPLFVKWPGGDHAGEVRTAASGAIDLVPTLLDLFGLPREDLPGIPLQQRRKGGPLPPVFIDAPAWNAVVFSEHGDGGGRRKFIHNRATEVTRLFDLEADPGEFNNLAEAMPGEVQRLLNLIIRYRLRSARTLKTLERQAGDPGAAFAVESDPNFTPEERERLRSLGYL